MLVPSHPDNAGLFKMRLEHVSQRNEDLIWISEWKKQLTCKAALASAKFYYNHMPGKLCV